jgi:hypothetical protein
VRRALPISIFAVLLQAAPSPAAEATRTLQLSLPPSVTTRYAVENLAGAMRVRPASGDEVVVVATVHAESEDLAGAVRLEQVRTPDGRPALRVRYPLESLSTLRYPGGKPSGFTFLGWGGSSEVRYDGRRVRVSAGHGSLVYADVDVQVPRKALDAVFRNAIGSIQADGVQGTVRLDSNTGAITVTHAHGDIVADTGSGDVDGSDISGTFRCDTGSGECRVERFDGETLTCDTGSGNVTLRDVSARRIALDTGSGDVALDDGDAEQVSADTGSGDVRLALSGPRLASVKADTGSGDVALGLAADAAFEARADVGSGDIVNRFDDARPILRNREVVGYRRGDARIRIEVDSGSGDVVLQPAP